MKLYGMIVYSLSVQFCLIVIRTAFGFVPDSNDLHYINIEGIIHLVKKSYNYITLFYRAAVLWYH